MRALVRRYRLQLERRALAVAPCSARLPSRRRRLPSDTTAQEPSPLRGEDSGAPGVPPSIVSFVFGFLDVAFNALVLLAGLVLVVLGGAAALTGIRRARKKESAAPWLLLLASGTLGLAALLATLGIPWICSVVQGTEPTFFPYAGDQAAGRLIHLERYGRVTAHDTYSASCMDVCPEYGYFIQPAPGQSVSLLREAIRQRLLHCGYKPEWPTTDPEEFESWSDPRYRLGHGCGSSLQVEVRQARENDALLGQHDPEFVTVPADGVVVVIHDGDN